MYGWCRDTLKNILLSVYGNKESVDEILVQVYQCLLLMHSHVHYQIFTHNLCFYLKMQIISEPAYDEGALDAFVSIVTGPPGPNPVQLMPKISLPVLVLWGNQDPFTPLDGPVGKYFSTLPSQLSNVSLFVLEGVGHCPHDDRPELVHAKLLPWLAHLPASWEIRVYSENLFPIILII